MLALNETEAAFDARVGVGADTAAEATATAPARAVAGSVTLSVHDDLAAVEGLWRAFEAVADGTAFQTFAWHAAWQKHIGDRHGVKPVIVVGRAHGRTLFILPLALEQGRLMRRLVWHASALCDYNAPLLAPHFAEVVGEGGFTGVFDAVARLIHSRTAFDAVLLEKMPETIGVQSNPFLALATTLNPSGAYLMRLGTAWDAFYAEKRSSATRRRDRTKRKRLADIGALRFVTPEAPVGIAHNLEVLFEQKGKAFAGMGVSNFLAKPGVRDFFVDLATAPETRDLVHVSQFDVGETLAAANLGLVFRGRYYHVLASYDGGPTAKFGPGVVHLHELMAYAIGRGCNTFDFTIGDESYKREWSDVKLDLYDHRCATTVRGLLLALPGAVATHSKRVIKQTPVLWRMARAARVFFGRLGYGARPAPEDTHSAD